MITEADAKKFQELYKIETGKDISSEDAFECVRNLVELLRRVYRPIKKNDFEKFSNKLTLKSYEKTMPHIYK